MSGQLEILAVSRLPAQTASLELTPGDQSSVEASDLLCALGKQAWHCPAVGDSHRTNHTAYPQWYDRQSARNLAEEHMQFSMDHDLGERLIHSAAPGIWPLLPTGTLTKVYYRYIDIVGKKTKVWLQQFPFSLSQILGKQQTFEPVCSFTVSECLHVAQTLITTCFACLTYWQAKQILLKIHLLDSSEMERLVFFQKLKHCWLLTFLLRIILS